MNIKTITTSSLLLSVTLSVSAQVPSMPSTQQQQQQLQQSATQTQQSATQLQQTGTQQLQKANTQAQQTTQAAAAKTTGSASFIQKAEKEVSNIAAKVNNLTPDQKAKLKDLYVQYFTKKSENKAAAAGDADKQKQLNSGLSKFKSDGLKSILSSDQLTALKNAAVKKVSQ